MIRSTSRRVLALFCAALVGLVLLSLVMAVTGSKMTRGTLLAMTMMQNVLVFIIPAMLVVRQSCPKPWHVMGLDVAPDWWALLLVAVAYVVSIPVLNYTVHLNEAMHLPSSLSWLEQMMRASEDAAQAVLPGAIPDAAAKARRIPQLQLEEHLAEIVIELLEIGGALGLGVFRFRVRLRRFRGEALRHRRQFVAQAGKQGAGPVLGERNAAQTVEDAPVGPHEDHVRGSPHQFGDEAELGTVAQFIPALQPEDDQAVAVWLFHAADARAGQVFAQQHAEHGRFFGVFEALLREMHTGVGPGGTDQEFSVLPFRAYRQKEQILLRLLDFFDSAVCEAFGEFLRQR